MKHLNLILMPHILPTPANETISTEFGDITILSVTISSPFAESAEMLQNASRHTDQKRQFVYELDRSIILFFFPIGGRKQEDIFLKIISILCDYG